MPERVRQPYQRRRSQIDVTYYWPGGASMRWQSRPDRRLTQVEMVQKLREIADMIEQHGAEQAVRAEPVGGGRSRWGVGDDEAH